MLFLALIIESTTYTCDSNEETEEVEQKTESMPKESRLYYKRSSIVSTDENSSLSQFERHIRIPSNSDPSHPNSQPNSDEGLPYSTYMPISMYCLHQTSAPRSWCLKMISNPYPFHMNYNYINDLTVCLMISIIFSIFV